MSKQEARRWALEFLAGSDSNWASALTLAEILAEYIMDGSFPPFDDAGGIELQKWLDGFHAASENSSQEAPPELQEFLRRLAVKTRSTSDRPSLPGAKSGLLSWCRHQCRAHRESRLIFAASVAVIPGLALLFRSALGSKLASRAKAPLRQGFDHSSISSSVLADGDSGDSVAADPRNNGTPDTSEKGVNGDA